MTDASAPSGLPVRRNGSLLTADAQTRRRNSAERRFRAYGLIAVIFGLGFLLILAVSIFRAGLPAFQKTVLEVQITLDPAQFDEAEAALLKTAIYKGFFVSAFSDKLAEAGLDATFDDAAIERMIGKPGGTLRAHYRANPQDLGQPVAFQLPASSRIDRYFKGNLKREDVSDSRFLIVSDLDLADALAEAGILHRAFNWTFITGADAGVDNPGAAGIGVSVIGSLFMMLVVLVLSLPIGVAASIYLEEFAPRNWITDLIEVNISNLAAVPSIVFGILGLAVFIQFAHLPQSAPLVGGLVLTLMTLPTIIISTRASLKAVPPSIRDAALGVGASKMQSVFHHVLPLAAPGILTGTIIGLAQALGETAPLLLIGMVGFIARAYPDTLAAGFTDPNSAMPAQIYTWASRADASFYEKAWGGIIVLLVFLIAMNTIAIILRRRFRTALVGKGPQVNDMGQVERDVGNQDVKISASGVQVFYGDIHAIRDVNVQIKDKTVTAFIGPSGCGKSTFLRCINRMNDTIDIARVQGDIMLDGEDIYDSRVDPVQLRAKVGMVFQKPNPFPKSIYDNVAYGPRIHGLAKTRADLDGIVERALRRSAIWDEVKDRLGAPGTGLSGGQQQRLCIARAVATEPEVLLMDEPCSALDPIATGQVEDLIDELKANYSVVIVTHSMQQAARVSQMTAFFHLGNLVEYDETGQIFTNPKDLRTESYITGRIG